MDAGIPGNDAGDGKGPMELFDALGFRWDRAAIPAGVPVHSVERACFRFHKMLAEFVWDAGVVEGNTLTFPEVMTLLDGVTVGGRKIADQAQILNLIVASRRLLSLVRGRRFALDKATAMAIHALFAPTEAPESGAPLLRRTFDEGLACLMRDVPSPFERAMAFFMFGALQQFFFDGNKRTSRFMMACSWRTGSTRSAFPRRAPRNLMRRWFSSI